MKDKYYFENEEAQKLLEKVVSLEKALHVPIDSYIIDAIWVDNNEKLPIKEGKTPDKNKKDYVRPSDYVKGWSTWNEVEYKDVQSSLCDYILNEKKEKPIVWEEKIWIEIAEKRKEGKNTRNRSTRTEGT